MDENKCSIIIKEEIPEELLSKLDKMDYIGILSELKFNSGVKFSFVFHGDYTLLERLKLNWKVFGRYLSGG